MRRLTKILMSFPTTEDEDASLLDSGELTDWRERVILKFLMLRKRALRLTIQVNAAKHHTCTPLLCQPACHHTYLHTLSRIESELPGLKSHTRCTMGTAIFTRGSHVVHMPSQAVP